MPRQIIIEFDKENIRLIRDDTSSVFERTAILSAIIQTPNIPVLNKTNDKKNDTRNKTRNSKQ